MAKRDDPMIDTCPSCGARLLERLHHGQECPTCRSTRAWERYGHGEKLVVDQTAIANAEKQAEGQPDTTAWDRTIAILKSAAVMLVSVAGAIALLPVFRSWPLGPIEPLMERLGRAATWGALLGATGFLAGIYSFWRLRGSRWFRSATCITFNSIAVSLGLLTAVVGGMHVAGMGAFDWDYTTIPKLLVPETTAASLRRIMQATAVIVAPDENGNASGAIGAGAVIERDATRAWIVTCSHVAIPYAAVGSFRDTDAAHPVWVYLADGRNMLGRVRWVAPPPIDVALIMIETKNAPEPVPVLPDASGVVRGDGVTFVPNPMRAGWLRRDGTVSRREEFATPAGRYSVVHTDLPLQPGDSGTGLFDGLGRLIGLNTWGTAEPNDRVGISLPSETLWDALARIRSKDKGLGR